MNGKDTMKAKSLSEPKLAARENLGDLSDLEASITRHGLLQPPVVRRKNGKGEVLLGQRRLAALRKLRPNIDIEVIELDADDAKAMEIRLSEEFSKANMETLDKVHALVELKTLLESQGERAGHKDLAARVGVSSWTIQHYLNIAGLSEPVKKMAAPKPARTVTARVGPMKTDAKAGSSVTSKPEPELGYSALEALGQYRSSLTKYQQTLLGKKFAKGLLPDGRRAREALRWALDPQVPEKARDALLNNPGTSYEDAQRYAKRLEEKERRNEYDAGLPLRPFLRQVKRRLRDWTNGLRQILDLASLAEGKDREDLLHYATRARAMLDEFIERLEYEHEVPTEAQVNRILAKQTFIEAELVR